MDPLKNAYQKGGQTQQPTTLLQLKQGWNAANHFLVNLHPHPTHPLERQMSPEAPAAVSGVDFAVALRVQSALEWSKWDWKLPITRNVCICVCVCIVCLETSMLIHLKWSESMNRLTYQI